ncbi:MarR family transcriptional regulator [Corynebacterium sp. H128]|uniref:MarR family winged helix-turn-helix transcriptional regulator n=1 Tax=Corynebacterium sp. H128 TaxID=3133427 RepID=UPI003098D057
MGQLEQLEGRIGYVLKQVDVLLRAEMENVLRPLGLTVAQYACLEVLDERGAQSSAELARASFVSRQSMNVMLKTMEKHGWVQAVDVTGGGRVRPFQITPQGEDGLAPAREAVLEVEERMVAGLSEKDQSQLLRLLLRCMDQLD